MIERFIVRLLDAQNALLAWAELQAVAKPQPRPAASCPLWAIHDTIFAIEAAGTVSQMSVHWVDLDIARVQSVEPTAVTVGQLYTYTWLAPVWIVSGMKDVPLPAVTVRTPQTVTVPTAAMGARDPRPG